MDREKVILVKGLEKKFGDFTAVDQISFEVSRGEIFGFLGPNGSGKTTTIRMMLGLLEPTQGSVEILGVRVRDGAVGIRRRVGYMSQRFSLYNDLTVIQNLRFYGAAYGLDEAALSDRIENALGMAGLEGKENSHTRDLSGGWRQRLALSVAIIHQPEVIFLDEPTAGVDPLSRRAFWDLLYQLVAEGVTVFVTTHYMDEAEHCQRLAFIQEGRIIAYGTPEEIRQSTLEGSVFEIAVSDPGKALDALQEAIHSGSLQAVDVDLYGSRLHVSSRGNARIEKQINNVLKRTRLKIEYLEEINPSLEDIFISSMNQNRKKIE